MEQVIDFEKIRRLSADIRIQTIRAIAGVGSGHIGGSASIADVLAVLYGGVMNIDPQNPAWEERDRLVLSKGHCAPALYAVLALKGYFPEKWLDTLNKPGTRLPSHADARLVPGVDMSTGSLGQGISSALGIALGNRLQKRNSWTYCIVGDGECNEGEVWEACEVAAHQNADHLIIFVDWNKKQLDGPLEKICRPYSLAEKFASFGMDVQVVKGYIYEEIFEAVEQAKRTKGKAHVIVLDTMKGLGVNFAEKAEANHHMAFDREMAESAIAEIERRLEENTYPGGEVRW